MDVFLQAEPARKKNLALLGLILLGAGAGLGYYIWRKTGAGIIEIENVTYSTYTPQACQRITANVTIRNTGRTKLTGRLWGTFYLAGTNTVAGHFWPPDYTPTPGEPARPLLIEVPAGKSVTVQMLSWKIAESRTMDVAWETQDNRGYRYDRRVDAAAIRPAFSGWPTC
jgi:hypothetical protein